MKKLLDVKKQLKKRQPTFKRQESYLSRVSDNWRKPRGLQSKLRLRKRSHNRLSRGYQTPKVLRDTNAEGLSLVRVTAVEQLAELDPKQHALIIGRVGAKRKVELIEASLKTGFALQNASKESAAALQKRHEARHEAKQAEKKAREAKHKKLEEKLEKEEKKAEKDAEKKDEKPAAGKETSPAKEEVNAAEKKDKTPAKKGVKATPAAKPEEKKPAPEKKVATPTKTPEKKGDA